MQRLGLSPFDDFTGALTELHQTCTVKEYPTKFEKLANHTDGFPDAFYMICFISGMKDTIRSKVKMLYPITMMESLGLDNLAEDKIITQQHSKSTFVPFINMVSQRPPITPVPRTTLIKHFSEAKMRTHREKRICHNCDEKFF